MISERMNEWMNNCLVEKTTLKVSNIDLRQPTEQEFLLNKAYVLYTVNRKVGLMDKCHIQ